MRQRNLFAFCVWKKLIWYVKNVAFHIVVQVWLLKFGIKFFLQTHIGKFWNLYHFPNFNRNSMIQKNFSPEHLSWLISIESLSFYWYHVRHMDFNFFVRVWRMSFLTNFKNRTCTEHFKVHYNENIDYCYPFRVLQKPKVSLKKQSTVVTSLQTALN